MSGTPGRESAGAPRASLHRNIRGRERELHRLANGVRRLIRYVTTNVASREVTERAARDVEALADALEPDLPDTPPGRYDLDGRPSDPHDFFPYDPVLGPFNPLALPVEMAWHPPKAIGRATFDTPYEGPPGCVHGAILAAVFDQALNTANLQEGCPGPTASLTLEYLRPTPLHRELVFEAWVEARDANKVFTHGQVSCDDRICVEARGLFIAIDFDRIQSLRADE